MTFRRSLKTKITTKTAEQLISVPNIRGIKTGDLVMTRKLLNGLPAESEFSVMYAHLDTFDVAYTYGVKMTLDGIYSITAPLAARLCAHLKAGESDKAAKTLDDIVVIRDTTIGVGLWQGFSYAMNLLGYEGQFHPDYLPKVPESDFDTLRACMVQHGVVI